MVVKFRGLLYSLFAWTLFLLFLITEVRAEVGVTVCGCQPVEYEIRLQFNLTCQDANVGGLGISETACVPSKETNEDVTDFVPVLVTNIRFLELTKDSLLLQQDPRTGAFLDGDTVRYTSFLAAQTSLTVNETTLPQAFQMAMRGRNAADQQIQLTWVIFYSNACGVVPVLFEGQQQGWSVFVRTAAHSLITLTLPEISPSNPSSRQTELTSPMPSLCQNSPLSLLPSTTPVTLSPMIPPRSTPTRNPIELPTSFPTFYPASTASPTTFAPIAAPSCSPSRLLAKGKGKGKIHFSTVMGKAKRMGVDGDSYQYRGKIYDYGKMKMAMGNSMKKRFLGIVPTSVLPSERETLSDVQEFEDSDEKLSLYYRNYYGDRDLASAKPDGSFGALGPRELFRGDTHGQYRGMESSFMASMGCPGIANPNYKPVRSNMKAKKKGSYDIYKGAKGGKTTTGSNRMFKGMYTKKPMSSRSKMGKGKMGKNVL